MEDLCALYTSFFSGRFAFGNNRRKWTCKPSFETQKRVFPSSITKAGLLLFFFLRHTHTHTQKKKVSKIEKMARILTKTFSEVLGTHCCHPGGGGEEEEREGHESARDSNRVFWQRCLHGDHTSSSSSASSLCLIAPSSAPPLTATAVLMHVLSPHLLSSSLGSCSSSCCGVSSSSSSSSSSSAAAAAAAAASTALLINFVHNFLLRFSSPLSMQFFVKRFAIVVGCTSSQKNSSSSMTIVGRDGDDCKKKRDSDDDENSVAYSNRLFTDILFTRVLPTIVRFRNLRVLSLRSCNLEDAHLERLVLGRDDDDVDDVATSPPFLLPSLTDLDVSANVALTCKGLQIILAAQCHDSASSSSSSSSPNPKIRKISSSSIKQTLRSLNVSNCCNLVARPDSSVDQLAFSSCLKQLLLSANFVELRMDGLENLTDEGFIDLFSSDSASHDDDDEQCKTKFRLRLLSMSLLNKLTPASIAVLDTLHPTLEQLYLRDNDTSVTDESLQAAIRNCDKLEVLDLKGCSQLTDKAFVLPSSSSSSKMQHQEADKAVAEPSVSEDDDAGQKNATTTRTKSFLVLPASLKVLNVKHIRSLTNYGLKYIADSCGCTSLEEFEMDLFDNVTGDGLRYFAWKCCSCSTSKNDDTSSLKMTKLELSWCRAVAPEDFVHLKHFSRLKSLTIHRTKSIGDNALAACLDEMVFLEELNLMGVLSCSDEVLARGIPHLLFLQDLALQQLGWKTLAALGGNRTTAEIISPPSPFVSSTTTTTLTHLRKITAFHPISEGRLEELKNLRCLPSLRALHFVAGGEPVGYSRSDVLSLVCDETGKSKNSFDLVIPEEFVFM